MQKVLAQIVTDHGAVIFNGNGYSDEWQEEAAARGLLNLRTTVDALPQLAEPINVDVLAKYKVLDQSGAGQPLRGLPRAVHPQRLGGGPRDGGVGQDHHPAGGSALPGRVGGSRRQPQGRRASRTTPATLTSISGLVTDLLAAIAELEAALAHDSEDGSSLDHATYARDELIPPMAGVRAAADALEGLVADDLWPLPTYQEMLNIL